MGCANSTKVQQRGSKNLADDVHGGDPNATAKSKPKMNIPEATRSRGDAENKAKTFSTASNSKTHSTAGKDKKQGNTSVFEVSAPSSNTDKPDPKSPGKQHRVTIDEPREQNVDDESSASSSRKDDSDDKQQTSKKTAAENNSAAKNTNLHSKGSTENEAMDRNDTLNDGTVHEKEATQHDKQNRTVTNKQQNEQHGDKNKRTVEGNEEQCLQNAQEKQITQPAISSPLRIRGTSDDITDLDVDVIVSSEDSQLQGFGMVAKHLGKKGGKVFTQLKQDTLSMCKDNIVSPWEFTSSPGEGAIKCKRVFHANVMSIQHIGDQMKWLDGLGSLILRLFLRADQMGFTSVALPLLGTGRLGASSGVVIDLFVERIKAFKKSRSSKPFLKDIYIVHPDKRIVNEVQVKVKGLSSESTNTSSSAELETIADTKRNKLKKAASATEEICSICMDTVENRKELHICHHVFCKDCIDRCFEVSKPVCPICNTVYGTLTGNQPNGYMLEVFRAETLPGFKGIGTIYIFYIFGNGIQEDDHPHKGKPYTGTKRNGFLPDNDDGQKVYRLLRRSFEQKLTFTIGSSRTTGKDDVVTWNDVHHKTRFDGGPERYGYPDHTYISRVMDELRVKGITED